jgi:GPH family glycoside/pentoside/hexuronide:cation symporter
MTFLYNHQAGTLPQIRREIALQQPSLTTTKIWIYGSLGFPLALLGYPLGIWLPRAYSTYIGIATESVGVIMIIASIFDALTDPVMGFASDRFRTRWGRRRVWVFIGAPLLLLALVFLLNPAAGSGVFYLCGWFMFLRIGATMVGTPYGAWGAELSGEYHMRTRIVSVREIYVLLGLIGAALVPALVEQLHGTATTAVMVLNAYTLPVVILLPVLTVLVVARVPEPPPSAREGRVPFVDSLALMYRNKLFLRLICIELCIGGGEAFRNAVSLFFMQDYIGVPRAGTLYLVYFGMGLIAIPFWSYLARVFGKHRSLSGAIIFVSAVSITIFNLHHGQIMPFYVLFALKGFCFGSFAYLPRAMMADVIDLDTLKSGDARTGGYFAILGFMSKTALSLGGLALIALSWVGYDTKPGAVHDAGALQWLAILYAIVPTASFMLGLYLCWNWPLTRAKHAQLQRLLESRQNRLKRGAAVSV